MYQLNLHKPINQNYGISIYQKFDSSSKLKSFQNQLTNEFNNLIDKSAIIKFIAKDNEVYYSIYQNNNWQNVVKIDCLPTNFIETSKLFSFLTVYEFFINYSTDSNKFSAIM